MSFINVSVTDDSARATNILSTFIRPLLLFLARLVSRSDSVLPKGTVHGSLQSLTRVAFHKGCIQLTVHYFSKDNNNDSAKI